MMRVTISRMVPAAPTGYNSTVPRVAAIAPLLGILLSGCGGSGGPPREPTSAPRIPTSHVIAFASSPLAVSGVAGDARDPLPTGLMFDPKIGRITGAAAGPSTGRLYQVTSDWLLYLEIVPRPDGDDVFVAPSGDDAGDGTASRPFRTIARALRASRPGTTVFLRAGRYREDVTLAGIHGARSAPIVLRSFPGERAVIEGARLDVSWIRATDPDAAPDEWVSTRPFELTDPENPANRGVLAEKPRYIRLLTYSRLEDLRAENQRWSLDGAEPGPNVTIEPYRPWTYFGPGIWHDPQTGLIRLRLSHTRNREPALADFAGPGKPGALDLGVWYRASAPLTIRQSSHVEVRDLEIVGGGDRTVMIDRSSDILFDHVAILAATTGVSIGESTRVKLSNVRIDGGVPPWTFRSDYKDNYQFTEADGRAMNNDLIRKTSRALLHVRNGNADIEIAYCEIANGHDNIMAGVRSSLHHCLLRNIHDDAMFISQSADTDDLRIHDNVFEQILTGLSAEGGEATGPRYVYRNIFDLRDPTAGFRPGLRETVWRWGAVFKGDFSTAPLYFYQNTLLVARPGEHQAIVLLFRGLERDGIPVHPRWFLNNVIAVDSRVSERPLGFVPAQGYLAIKQPDGSPVLRSEGNVWFRLGGGRMPMFRCLTLSDLRCTRREWTSVEEIGPMGFEQHSRSTTSSVFVKLNKLSHSDKADDLRARPGGVAQSAAVELPEFLPDSVPPTLRRSAGARPPHAERLRVGVDGRHVY